MRGTKNPPTADSRQTVFRRMASFVKRIFASRSQLVAAALFALPAGILSTLSPLFEPRLALYLIPFEAIGMLIAGDGLVVVGAQWVFSIRTLLVKRGAIREVVIAPRPEEVWYSRVPRDADSVYLVRLNDRHTRMSLESSRLIRLGAKSVTNPRLREQARVVSEALACPMSDASQL